MPENARGQCPINRPGEEGSTWGGLKRLGVGAPDTREGSRRKMIRTICLEHNQFRGDELARDLDDHLCCGVHNVWGSLKPPCFDDRSAPIRHPWEIAEVRVNLLNGSVDGNGPFHVRQGSTTRPTA